MIGLQHYLTVSAMLFVLAIAGIVVNRRNLILLLMCIELMLLAVNTNCRRGGDRACDPRCAVPQPPLHRGAGAQYAERLICTATT